MGPLDAIWHLLNFAAPAPSVAVLTWAGVWLFWRHRLQACACPLGLASLAWAVLAALLALVLGLVAFGHDGKMVTYWLVMAAVTGVLWWRHLRHLPAPGPSA